MRKIVVITSFMAVLGLTYNAFAQDYDDFDEEESSLQVNGYIQVQSGLFVPLGLDGIFDSETAFRDHTMEAYKTRTLGGNNVQYLYDQPCDPNFEPSVICRPINHGGMAGSPSMMRGTIQLEADWTPFENVTLHTVLQGVRALALEQDYWAQPPNHFDVSDKPQWVVDNIYNRLDLREFYLDIYASDWLSFRLGRQQVTWGETGQYRLLDVINPTDSSWHFGPLESFQDTRIPLWIAKAMIEFPAIEHNLELVWVPGIDRPEDSVTVPLTFVGAWGVPATNTPSSFKILEKKFMYPSQDMPDSMRGGLRWKGNIGSKLTYSLVYYYTHQMSPPVPTYYDLQPLTVDGQPMVLPGGGVQYDTLHMETLYLEYPRQHVLGGTIDYTFDNPIGLVAKLEVAVEPDRTFARTSKGQVGHTLDNDFGDGARRYYMNPIQKTTINYAVVLMRPTMIRALNPTQNFLFMVQWMHEIIPNIEESEAVNLVVVPGFNDWTISEHSWKIVGVAMTRYMNGLLTPKVIAAYVHPNSGFITASLGVRVGEKWRLQLQLTDFFGDDPYKQVGMFRDRDEVNLRIRYQF